MKQLYYEQSGGPHGSFELEINCAASGLPDLQTDAIRNAVYTARDAIKEEVMAAVLAADPETQEQRVKERRDLLGLFDGADIFVQEIPNEYCNRWCCRNRPWFLVTTRVGTFKIGWRKSVIEVDWTATLCKNTALLLFPDDRTTRTGQTIHANTLSDAQRHILTVMAQVKHETETGKASQL